VALHEVEGVLALLFGKMTCPDAILMDEHAELEHI